MWHSSADQRATHQKDTFYKHVLHYKKSLKNYFDQKGNSK